MTDDGRGVDKRIAVCIAVALFLLGLALYLPSLRFGFVEYDDVRILLNHPKLYDEHSLFGSLREIFVGYFPREEPLLVRDLTWAFDSRLFGFKNAFGYHLGNVLLDAANAPLVFGFLVYATARVRFAAVVAALFAVLPVHVEAVAWVMGRKDVLSAFFALGTLVCEARAFRLADRRRARNTQLVGLVFFSLATLSKISAVVLVAVIAAYRVLAPAVAGERTRWLRPSRAMLLALMPHAIVAAAAYVWYDRILHRWGAFAALPPAPPTHVIDHALLTALTLGLYVKSIFVPSEYSIVYQWPDSAIPLTLADQLTAVAVAIAVVAFFGWAARRRRDLLFYGVAFLVLMIPYLHIVSVTRWRADRYVYLSSFCLLAIAVQLGGELLARAGTGLRRVAVGAVVVWAASAVLVTLTTEPRFHDNHALWSYEVGLRRPSVLAYDALASSFVDRARNEHDPDQRQHLLADAERVARAGIDYYASIPWRAGSAPKVDVANLHVQLGQVSGLRGEPLAAQLGHYRDSYRIQPTEANHIFLAQTLFKMAAATGNLALARESLRLIAEEALGRAGDAARRSVMTRILERYRQAFPALAPDVDTIEKALH